MIGIAGLALAPERAQAIVIDFGPSTGSPMLMESDHYSDQGLIITDNGSDSGMCSGLECSWLMPATVGGVAIDGLYVSAEAADPATETTFMLYFGDGATDISFDYATDSGEILMSMGTSAPDLEATSMLPYGTMQWGQVSLANESPLYALQVSALDSGQLILDNVAFSAAIPEPSAALVFGIGALITSRGLRRSRSARTRN